MNMGKRIAQRLRELGWKQTHLLDKVPDLSPGTLSAIILRDSKRSEFVSQIASALGVTVNWLQDGVEPKEPKGLAGMYASFDRNTSTGPDIKERQIPLISWVQAGTFCSSPDLLEPGDAEMWLPSHKIHGKHTYALRVKGTSMIAPYPGQRSYPEGTIIYVDPDKTLTNGCRVVARIHDNEEATFKEYVEDAGKRYLRPLNPQFPTIEMTEDMHICGVVVLSTMEE